MRGEQNLSGIEVAVSGEAWRWNPRKLDVYENILGSPARHVLLVGGARSGKTALICRSILSRALRARKSRHAILRSTANAAWQSIAMDTLPKVCALSFPGIRLKEHSDAVI